MFRFLVALTILGYCPWASASVVIDGTRVIYPAEARDVGVRLRNEGDYPVVVQAWLDRGDPLANPELEDVPFVLTPALVRMDPQKSQVLRLVFTGQALPADKESVFWLNVLEIPPKPDESAGSNYLQFATRSRIKVFYRPKTLQGDVVQAAAGLRWEQGLQARSVRVFNPSKFYISLAGVQALVDGKAQGNLMNGMVFPGESLVFNFEPRAGEGPIRFPFSSVSYKVINEFGAFIDVESPIQAVSSAKK